MIAKVKQYKNLILLVAAVVFMVVLIVMDPLGYCAERVHERAAIYNQMEIEKAEAEKEIAVIRAQMEKELKRIEDCQ